MPRFPTQPALALLGVLLCLAACTPTARPATVGRAPTTPPTATPARVPAGWKVLATAHFRLAYPPDWRTFSMYEPGQEDAVHTGYDIATPDPAGHVQLEVSAQAKVDVSPSCPVATSDTQPPQPTTLAGLPMGYLLVPYPQGAGVVRWWVFLNAQQTSYILRAFDGDASAATQAQDDAILATFRPDNATPWQC